MIHTKDFTHRLHQVFTVEIETEVQGSNGLSKFYTRLCVPGARTQIPVLVASHLSCRWSYVSPVLRDWNRRAPWIFSVQGQPFSPLEKDKHEDCLETTAPPHSTARSGSWPASPVSRGALLTAPLQPHRPPRAPPASASELSALARADPPPGLLFPWVRARFTPFHR